MTKNKMRIGLCFAFFLNTIAMNGYAATFRMTKDNKIQIYSESRNRWGDFDPERAPFLNNPQTERDFALKAVYEAFMKTVAARTVSDQKTVLDEVAGQEKCDEPEAPGPKANSWGFSSDHLPVGAQAQVGDTKFGIATFNVLNELYKSYIQAKNGQNLKGSTLDRMTESQRDDENVQIITDGLRSHNIGVFAVQEASLKFSNKLKEAVGNRYDVLVIQSGSKDDYGLLIYDTEKFEKIENPSGIEPASYITSKGIKNKYIQPAQLKNKSDGTSFAVINTHAEFGEGQQLVNYLNRVRGPVIAMGDLNLAYNNEGRKETDIGILKNLKSGYQRLVGATNFSHFNTKQALDTYDHILSKEVSVTADRPLTQSLQKTFTLKDR